MCLLHRLNIIVCFSVVVNCLNCSQYIFTMYDVDNHDSSQTPWESMQTAHSSNALCQMFNACMSI